MATIIECEYMNVSYRKCGHENVDELLWVTTDTGAFGNERDGPLFDWISCKEFFLEKVKKFDVVVQAGGNCGMYPRFYKNYFGHVITFEPDETNYHCLNANCQGDGYTKTHGGLGNTTWRLHLKNNSLTNVGTHKIVDTPGIVQMYRLDDMNLKACDLIHLDVEGYEENALLGAIETIKKFEPVVITERSGGEKLLFDLGYIKHRQLRMDTVYIKI
jgi:FkbM family methyltransferase